MTYRESQAVFEIFLMIFYWRQMWYTVCIISPAGGVHEEDSRNSRTR